jgi:hypothetical protein
MPPAVGCGICILPLPCFERLAPCFAPPPQGTGELWSPSMTFSFFGVGCNLLTSCAGFCGSSRTDLWCSPLRVADSLVELCPCDMGPVYRKVKFRSYCSPLLLCFQEKERINKYINKQLVAFPEGDHWLCWSQAVSAAYWKTVCFLYNVKLQYW